MRFHVRSSNQHLILIWLPYNWWLCFLIYGCCGRITAASIASQLRPPRITEHPSNLVVRKHEPATLNCKAEGKPTPTIEWYRDGELVHNTNSRMVLPSGSLFFLQVIHSKRDSVTGTYWCVAKNEAGKARSRNASLEIAMIRDDFRVVPKNVQVSTGDTATLECSPPRGYPEPTVTWKKDGVEITTATSDRIHLNAQGSLLISDVQQSDVGRYVCVAQNMAGTRESPPALLNIHVKPFFVQPPEDTTALANDEVEFQCRVEGDPPPTISWRKQDGRMPVGRAQISDDKSLKIKQVTIEDEGVYICEAENQVGTASAPATLTVHSRPTFTHTPKNQKVGLNGIAKFECSASGNPPPSVFWAKEGTQVLMFPGRSHGRFSVTLEGTLIISGVKKEDKGYYICSALSVVGSLMTKSYLDVTAVADLPPPIIRLGSANQTLPMNTRAMLPCEASGTPPPTIRWYVNSTPINLSNPRFIVVDSGTLQIDDLQISDTALYTCTASSESGETSWSSSLTVESPRNPNVNFHRSPEPFHYPGPPTKPVTVNVTETTITLTWRRNANSGSSQVIGYIVEYYSSDLQSGWVVAAHRVPREVYTVQNLRPDSRYMFLIRAENSHGIGYPSPVSDEVRTLGLPLHLLPDFDLEEARTKLSTCAMTLRDVRPISSTGVKLFWELQGSHEYVEGFYIRFRDVSGGSQKYNMVTVLNGGASSYVLSDLKKFTKYEFFLVPFYKSVDGPPSNSKMAQTLEDVPSSPPDNLQVQLVNLTSAVVHWSPPPPQHRNGIIRGYNVIVILNSTLIHSNITVRNATTTSLTLYNLTSGQEYKIKTSALTSPGHGPFSKPFVFTIDPKLLQTPYLDRPSSTSLSRSFHDIARQPLFIALVGGIMFLMLTITFIIIFIKRRQAWKKTLSAHLSVPVNKGQEISDSTSDYAEVDTFNMTTFYKKDVASVPALYATTTLVPNPPKDRHSNCSATKDKASSDGGSNRRNDSKQFGSESTQTSEGCAGNIEHDSITPSDSSSYTTDEYGMPIKKKHPKRLRSNEKAPSVNWAHILPPPPEKQSLSETEFSHRSYQNCDESPLPVGIKQLKAQSYLQSPHSPLTPRSYHSPVGSRASLSSPRSTLSRAATDHYKPSLSTRDSQSSRLQTFPKQRFQRSPLASASHDQPLLEDSSNQYMDRGIQSSLPSLINEAQEYQELVPESSNDRTQLFSYPCSQPSSWANMTDHSNSSGNSPRSSITSSFEGSSYAEADFLSFMGRAGPTNSIRIPCESPSNVDHYSTPEENPTLPHYNIPQNSSLMPQWQLHHSCYGQETTS